MLDILDPAVRANACRNKLGNARPFRSLPTELRNSILFTTECDGSGSAVWMRDGEGMEPPPYWVDEQRRIHNL